MPITNCPILVISYIDATRAALVASLQGHGILPSACPTFKDAEQLALTGEYCGILVDLAAMIKAKDEEKVIACALANVYPALRVRTMGPMLIPMTMPGTAAQDKSLSDFLQKTCATFSPRRLRAGRRNEVCLPVSRGEGAALERGVTLNLSWGGAFILDLHPERFFVGQQLLVDLPGLVTAVQVEIIWLQAWGERRMPGYGVRFMVLDATLASALEQVLPPGSRQARDRLVG